MFSSLHGLLAITLCIQVGLIGSEESSIRIITAPERYSLPVGANVTFPCTVINLDESVVTWSKDGQVISADSFKVLQDNRIVVNQKAGAGVDLLIHNLKVTDTGLYTCAVNLNKKVKNIVHKLIVEVPPYIDNISPGNQSITVRSGSRVRLECTAGGQPKPNVYWKRMHNLPFTWVEGGKTELNGAVLDLENVQRGMEGDYMCVAENGVGPGSVSKAINIDVLYPPEVTGERTWIHAGLGEEVALVCRVYANPEAKVSWYKRTMRLMDGERIHFQVVGNSHKLILSQVGEPDYGEYFCRADNSLEEEVKQKFTITGKPSKPSVVGDREGRDRYSYDLEWRLRSSLPVAIHEIHYWEADQSNPDNVSSPPRNAHIRRVTGHGQVAESYSFSMKGLKNSTFYDVIVRSQNKYGWSPYSDVFTFRTADKENLMLVRAPSTERPVYQQIESLKSEPVTSSAFRSTRSYISESVISIAFLMLHHHF